MSDYTMTNQEFICAAGSYFGLPGEQLMQGSKLETQEDGALEIVIRLALKPDDMIGIGRRMEAMREMPSEPMQPEKAQEMLQRTGIKVPSDDDLRRSYNGLLPHERSYYGSFSRYRREQLSKLETEFLLSSPANTEHLARSLEQSRGIGDRKVSHIDAPEEEEPAQMDAVWLWHYEASPAQKAHASDYCDTKGYLVQWAMLTDEQKQKAKEAKP